MDVSTLPNMKTIGILGGMSAVSTIHYYQELCQLTRAKYGKLHSPELLIRSLDFAPIAQMQAEGRWEEAGRMLNREARALVRAGAEVLVLATNTMHKVVGEMMEGVVGKGKGVELVHIGDATAQRIVERGWKKPGLIATKFTMEEEFYVERLRGRGLEVVIPEPGERVSIQRVIYDELCNDVVREESRVVYMRIAKGLVARGADCLILGCTEVGMLLNQANVEVDVFDTTRIHCEVALEVAVVQAEVTG